MEQLDRPPNITRPCFIMIKRSSRCSICERGSVEARIHKQERIHLAGLQRNSTHPGPGDYNSLRSKSWAVHRAQDLMTKIIKLTSPGVPESQLISNDS